MQTLDDTIAEFTPPVSDKCMREYEQRFRYGDKSRNTFVWVVVCVMKISRDMLMNKYALKDGTALSTFPKGEQDETERRC